MKKVKVCMFATCCAVALFWTLPVWGQVVPNMVGEELAPGESIEVTKQVTIPEVPPKLDICLIVDLSGSYWNDLPNIKALAPGLFDSVKAEVSDVRFGLATFVDYPFPFWGWPGDYAYRLEQDLTPNKVTWVNAVNGMATKNGGDGPESQYEALYQVATGAGRDVSPSGASLGDIPAGQNCSFRDDATKIAILTTDASFHVAGDGGGPFPYPGPLAAATTTELQNKGIKVVGLKAPGSGGELDALASATGGVVKSTTSSSSDIADAILEALEEITFDVTGTAIDCDPLVVSFSPTSHESVLGGVTVEFEETIAVPDDVTGDMLGDDGMVHCTVEFKADDTTIGIQEIWIKVRRLISIDIKPGSFPNSVNPGSKGVVPVAILGSSDFDVADVDGATLLFGPGEASPKHIGNPEDVNLDGFLDLVSHYKTQLTGIAMGDTQACLKGKTLDGIIFVGCDSLKTPPASSQP